MFVEFLWLFWWDPDTSVGFHLKKNPMKYNWRENIFFPLHGLTFTGKSNQVHGLIFKIAQCNSNIQFEGPLLFIPEVWSMNIYDCKKMEWSVTPGKMEIQGHFWKSFEKLCKTKFHFVFIPLYTEAIYGLPQGL